LLAVGRAALVAMRGLTRPLSGLATAARTLGTPAEGEALAEVGPAEVRQVARAFNDMRQRIGAMVDQKTRMLAAISHDLRAPITRMRLRVEPIEDAEARARLIADLEELHRLTDEALDFLRGTGGGEAAAPFDFVQLARAIVSEAREVGRDVVLVAPVSVVLMGRAGALRRCLQNLVDNAVRHAGSAEIELGTGDGAALLWMRDRGPGLAPDDLDRAFEPFLPRRSGARPSDRLWPRPAYRAGHRASARRRGDAARAAGGRAGGRSEVAAGGAGRRGLSALRLISSTCPCC
jgi:signal transduction histidine kinase